MAITFFWRCEGTTLSGTDDKPGADTSVSTGSGAPEISATAALIGSNGVLINAADEYYTLDSEAATMNAGAGAIGFYIRIQTFGSLSGVLNFRTNSGNSADRIAVYTSTTTNNHLKFRISDSNEFSDADIEGPAMSVDTTYFVIFKWDHSVNDRRVEVYDSGGSHISGSPVEDLATAWFNPVSSYPITNGLLFGESASVSAAYYLDNVFIGSTWADGDTIYTNRNITSYTQLGGGGGTTITGLGRRFQGWTYRQGG